MSLFVITYDLRKQRTYQKLYDELFNLKAFCVLESVFLIELESTALEVKEHFKSYIDDDDGLLVVEFDKRPAELMCNQGTINWLNNKFRSS